MKAAVVAGALGLLLFAPGVGARHLARPRVLRPGASGGDPSSAAPG